MADTPDIGHRWVFEPLNNWICRKCGYKIFGTNIPPRNDRDVTFYADGNPKSLNCEEYQIWKIHNQ